MHWNFHKRNNISNIYIYIHLNAFFTGYEYCDCNPVTVEFEWGNTALFEICQKATTLICLRSNYMHDQDILFWNDNAVNKSSKSLNAHLLLFQIFIAPWLIGEKAIVPLLTCNINTLCYKKVKCGFKFMSFWNEVSMCNSALNETESFGMRKLLIFYQIITLFFHRME